MSQSRDPNNWIGTSSAVFIDVMIKRTLENTIPYMLPVLASLPPNFSLLDVGCGPGNMTIDIARRYPEASIVGLDYLEEVLDIARKTAEQHGVKNISFIQGSALDLQASIQGATFHVVHTHQVLVHTMDAKKAMHEMRQATKPGGRVCCCEGDFGLNIAWPEDPLLKKIVSSRGSDPYVGRKLVSHAMAAGFKRENIEVGLSHKVFATQAERREFAALCAYPMRDVGVPAMENVQIEPLLNASEEWQQREDGLRILGSPWVVCRRVD